MYYSSYGYHSSETSPIGNTNELIYGVELEIDDDANNVREILDACIEDNIITAPYNEGETQNRKTIEEDSSVYREIILNADTQENILNCVKNLNDCGLSGENVCNGRGTSCHIHINKRYLQNKGITTTNILKLFELYAPIIYKISFRTSDTFNRWSEPLLNFNYHPLNINWEKRAYKITEFVEPNHNSRYHMVNVTNHNTIELRAFSNWHNFEYEVIKMYLDFVTFCINQAETMKGKLYKNEYQRLLNELETFFKIEYRYYYDLFNLRTVFNFDNELYKLQRLHSRTTDNINQIRYINKYEPAWKIAKFMHYQRITHIKNITLTERGKQNICKKLINYYWQELSSYYRNYYYRNENRLREEF